MPFPPGVLVRDLEAPELGVGRVLRYDDEQRASDVLFEGTTTPRVVRDEAGSSVRRLRLHPGQTVRLLDGSEAEVISAAPAEDRRDDEPWSYTVRGPSGEEELEELKLEPLPPRTPEPLDQLRALRWRGGWRFFARWNLQDKAGGWEGETEALPAWLAKREPPSAAAVYAAREVLYARKPHFVLSLPTAAERRDAATLVLLQLLHEEPERSVLVISPGASAQSWVETLYLEAGGRPSTRLDLGLWERSDELTRDELLDSERLVVTPTILAEREEVRAYLSGEPYDLLVIDDAHLLADDEQLGPWLAERGAEAEACLALAPPPAGDLTPLGPLLDLVEEGAGQGLAARIAAAEPFARAASALAAGDGSAAGDALAESKDPRVAELRGKLDDEDSCSELLDHLRRFYRVDPRLLVAGRVPKPRPAEVVSFERGVAATALEGHLSQLPAPSDPWSARWRLLLRQGLLGGAEEINALLAVRARALAEGCGQVRPGLRAAWDAAPSAGESRALVRWIALAAPAAPDEEAWLAEASEHVMAWANEGAARIAAAVSWLERHFADGGASVRLEVSGQAKGLDLVVAACVDALGADAVSSCPAEQSEVERADALRRFREEATCVLLVCAAGATTEEAAVVASLSPPVGPFAAARALERRGASRGVVILSDDPWEQALHELSERAPRELDAWAAREETLVGMATSAETLRALPQGEADDLWAALHDAPVSALEEAGELAEVLEEATVEHDSAELRAWGRCLRVKLRPDGMREWSMSWRPEALPRPLVGIAQPPAVEKVKLRGTFDPLHAREHPVLNKLAPGHPLIDALVRDSQSPDSDGRLTVIRRDLGAWPGKLALVVLVRCTLGEAAGALPEGARRRAQRRLWSEPYAEVVSLHPGKKPVAKPVTDRARRNLALAPFTGKEVEPKVDPDPLCDALPLPVMAEAIEAGIAVALEQIRAERAPLAEDAARQVAEDLAGERAFLMGVGAEEAIDRHEQLLEAVRGERYIVDAIALLVG